MQNETCCEYLKYYFKIFTFIVKILDFIFIIVENLYVFSVDVLDFLLFFNKNINLNANGSAITIFTKDKF